MRILALRAAPLFLAACAAPSTPASGTDSSPEDRRAVLEAVQAFFDVIDSGDAEAGARLVVPEGVFVNVRTEDGKRVVKHFSNAEWLARMRETQPSMHEAFEGEPTLLLDDDVAVVWGRYAFEVDGARSHVGIDAFTLVRTDEGWRIAGGAYSVERR